MTPAAGYCVVLARCVCWRAQCGQRLEEEHAEEHDTNEVHARREHRGDQVFRHRVGDLDGVLEEEGGAGEAEGLRGYDRGVELPLGEGDDPGRQEQRPQVEQGGDGQQGN